MPKGIAMGTAVHPDGTELQVHLPAGKVISALVGLAVILAGALLGGYYLYFNELVKNLSAGIQTAIEQNSSVDDRLSRSDEVLRQEISQQGRDFIQQYQAVSSELIETNREISRQVSQLRTELVANMRDSETRIMQRFDGLQEQLQNINPMRWDFQLRVGQGVYTINDLDVLEDDKGNALGTLPITLIPAEQ